MIGEDTWIDLTLKIAGGAFLTLSFLFLVLDIISTFYPNLAFNGISQIFTAGVAGGTLFLAYWTKQMVIAEVRPSIIPVIWVESPEKIDDEEEKSLEERSLRLKLKNVGKGTAKNIILRYSYKTNQDEHRHSSNIRTLPKGGEEEIKLVRPEAKNPHSYKPEDLILTLGDLKEIESTMAIVVCELQYQGVNGREFSEGPWVLELTNKVYSKKQLEEALKGNFLI